MIVIGGGECPRKQLISYATASWFSGRERRSEGRAYCSPLHRQKRWFVSVTAHGFFNHVKVRFSLVSGMDTCSTKPWSHSDTMHMCADKAAFQMTSSKVLSMLSCALHDDLIVSHTCMVEVIFQARKQCITYPATVNEIISKNIVTDARVCSSV